MQAFDGFALLVGVLTRQAEDVAGSGGQQIPVVVTEGTGFGCAAARPESRPSPADRHNPQPWQYLE